MRALAAAIARCYSGLYALIGLLCGALLGGIAFGITADVVLRNFSAGWLGQLRSAGAYAGAALGAAPETLLRHVGNSLPWVPEVNEYALYVVTALGAPWALRRGAHVRVDVVVQALPKIPARCLEVLGDVVGMIVSGALAHYAWVVGYAAYKGKNPLIKVLIIPEWWVYAVLVTGAVLLVIEFARRIGAVVAAAVAAAQPPRQSPA